jgi:hypothetical protein
MRYIIYGSAILAAMLTAAFTTGYLPRDATASHNEIYGTMNVHKLEETIGAKTLPQQDVPDEAYR